MLAPQKYVEWINANLGFNPRSQTNSNALSHFIVDDLRSASPHIDKTVASTELVALMNANVSTSVTIRNVDLVLHQKTPIKQVSVHVSVEHKTVMTAHGKARKNRYGDIIAYCNHMHNHRRDCVVGATVVINASPLYENPDSFARGMTRPRFDMEKVVRDTVGLFVSIPLRESPDDPIDQPEALAVIVVDYDGINPASLVTSELAPPIASHAHYDNFILRLAAKYENRFCE